MSAPRKNPVKPGTRAASHRNGLVHRIKDGTHLHARWLCGGAASITVLVKNPAEFGGICERCEVAFSGSVVYRCYSADGRLLYIGSCILWAQRKATHRKQTPWWPEVARVDEEFQSDLHAARRAERAAIKAEAPLYNKQHNTKRYRREGYEFVPVAVAA